MAPSKPQLLAHLIDIYVPGMLGRDILGQFTQKANRDHIKRLAKLEGKTVAHFVHDLSCQEGACLTCKGPTAWNKLTSLYRDYCSPSCANLDPTVLEQKKASCRLHHGVDFPQQSSKIRRKTVSTWRTTVGADNPSHSTKSKKKRLATFREKFGEDNPFQNAAVRQKIKDTCVEKYGVDHHMKSDVVKASWAAGCVAKNGAIGLGVAEFRQKADATTKTRTGVGLYTHTPEREAKRTTTMLAKYGYSYYASSPEAKERFRQTMRDTYGVDSPSQVPEIQEAIMAKRYKPKTVQLGEREVQVYGYEHYAITYLLSLGIKPQHILVRHEEGKPSIPFRNKHRRVYIPDLYVKIRGSWWLIEVKSTYTAGAKYINLFQEMVAKLKAATLEGYKIALLVFSPKGELLLKHKDPMTLKHRHIKAL